MGEPLRWRMRRWLESSTEETLLEAASALILAMVRRFWTGWGDLWRDFQKEEKVKCELAGTDPIQDLAKSIRITQANDRGL